MAATVRAQQIPNWKLVRSWAGDLSPADLVWADPGGSVSDQPIEDVTLIPYGCTNIRITEFPSV